MCGTMTLALWPVCLGLLASCQIMYVRYIFMTINYNIYSLYSQERFTLSCLLCNQYLNTSFAPNFIFVYISLAEFFICCIYCYVPL